MEAGLDLKKVTPKSCKYLIYHEKIVSILTFTIQWITSNSTLGSIMHDISGQCTAVSWSQVPAWSHGHSTFIWPGYHPPGIINTNPCFPSVIQASELAGVTAPLPPSHTYLYCTPIANTDIALFWNISFESLLKLKTHFSKVCFVFLLKLFCPVL